MLWLAVYAPPHPPLRGTFSQWEKEVGTNALRALAKRMPHPHNHYALLRGMRSRSSIVLEPVGIETQHVP